jgi:haloalkane dehalogenase
METFVAPLTLEDLPESFDPTLKAVRSSAGKALVLDENMFSEKMLPGVTQRTLSADETAEHRRPFLQAGDDRWPTLQWAREVPLTGEPADVHGRIAAYSAWLNTASLPKLFIDAEPGVFITGRIRKLASSFPNQDRVVVGGLHSVQEDSPDGVGRAIAGVWPPKPEDLAKGAGRPRHNRHAGGTISLAPPADRSEIRWQRKKQPRPLADRGRHRAAGGSDGS